MEKETKKLLIYNSIFCISMLVIGIGIYYSIPDPSIHGFNKKIDEVEVTKQSVELLGEMNKYLTAIAFVIIGVLGNILMGQIRLKHRENPFTILLFVLAMMLSLCSVFFGYVCYTKLFETISHHIFDVSDQQIAYAQKMQFTTLLISVFLFIWYLFNSYIYSAKKIS